MAEAQEILEQIYGFDQQNQTIDNIVVRENLSKNRYFVELRGEIVQYLQKYFKQGAQNMGSIYAKYSRARKSNLVSPGDFYKVCKMLNRIDGFVVAKCNNVEMLMRVDQRSQQTYKETLMAEILNRITGVQGIFEKVII